VLGLLVVIPSGLDTLRSIHPEGEGYHFPSLGTASPLAQADETLMWLDRPWTGISEIHTWVHAHKHVPVLVTVASCVV